MSKYTLFEIGAYNNPIDNFENKSNAFNRIQGNEEYIIRENRENKSDNWFKFFPEKNEVRETRLIDHIYNVDQALQNEQTFEVATYYPEKIDGMEEYLNRRFVYMNFGIDGDYENDILPVLHGKYIRLPYQFHEGVIEYHCGKYIHPDTEPDEIRGKLRNGYIQTKDRGDKTEINDQSFVFVGTVPVTREIEYQLKNNDLGYDDCGNCFVEIYIPENRFIEQ